MSEKNLLKRKSCEYKKSGVGKTFPSGKSGITKLVSEKINFPSWKSCMGEL